MTLVTEEEEEEGMSHIGEVETMIGMKEKEKVIEVEKVVEREVEKEIEGQVITMMFITLTKAMDLN